MLRGRNKFCYIVALIFWLLSVTIAN